jgi:glycerol-3-phosphate O-acyltransferase
VAVGRQLLRQGRLHGPESVSRELYRAAIQLAANRDVLDPGREPVRDGRRALLAEVEDVLSCLKTVGRVDEAMLEEVLDDVAG